ncbi:MAG: LamG domain-containing protein [Chloroflexi bacterium]|nr:LamG domain-containing protein [Chloroflexota bacterium]
MARDFIFDSSLALYLPLYQLDGASLMSGDAYGHLATVTGALWTAQGRKFDKVDDYIDAGNNPVLKSSVGTFELWLRDDNPPSDSEVLMWREDNSSNFLAFEMSSLLTGKFRVIIKDDGVTRVDLLTSAIFLDVSFNHIVVTQDGAGIRVYRNGAEEILTGTNSASYWTSFLTLNNTWLGRFASWYGAITLGELRVYNRALSAQEVKRNYLATKWRYR